MDIQSNQYLPLKEEYSFNILPFDVLYLLTQYDLKTFTAIRSVNRDIRDYTNEHMDVYKNRYLRVIRKEMRDKILEYTILPNGAKHGLYQEWRKDHVLIKRCFYADGLLDGLYQTFHWCNGSVSEECFYVKGNKVGEERKLTASGKFLEFNNYNDEGKLHGISRRWDNNSYTLVAEINYSNGLKDGYETHYYADGKFMSQSTWDKGIQVGPHERHDNFYSTITLCFYVNGKIDGPYNDFYYSGNLKYHCNYVNGKVQGPQEWFDYQGRVTAREVNGRFRKIKY